MSEKRLKTYIWVQAQQWRCSQLSVPFYVTHKGEESAGAVILKIALLDGRCRVYSQIRKADGSPAWQSRTEDGFPLPERAADDYIAKQLDFDPDLWVLEVEDPKGLYEVDGEIV